MKSIRTKVIVSFLSMMVVSGILAGCGKKANEAGTPAPASAPVELKVEVFDGHYYRQLISPKFVKLNSRDN